MWKTATTTTLASFAGLALTQTALGAAGDVTPVQPITGNIEAVSPGETGDTALILIAPTAIGANVVGGYGITGTFQIQLLDNTGANIGAPISIPNADTTELVDAGAAGDVESGDVVQIDVGPTLQLFGGAAWGFDIIVNDGDASVDSLAIDPDGFPGQGDDTDTVDMTYQISRVRPTISQVLINDSMGDDVLDELFIVGNFPTLGPGDDVASSFVFPMNAGVANPNNTSNGALSVADFEVDDAGDGIFANFTADDFGSADALADDQTYIKINIGDPTMTGLDIGDVVRIASGGDVWDGTGGFLDGEVAITRKEALSIDSAEWLAEVGAGGTVAGAIQVTMNLACSAAGDATFWDGLVRSDAAMTDLSVTAAAIDGADNTKINLTVMSGGTDSVGADGLEGDGTGMDDGSSFSISVDAMTGTPPDDIFATALTGTFDVDITDGIAPSQSGALVGLDMNSDGDLDAFYMTFDEVMVVTGGDSNGFTLTKLGAAVHPYSLFLTNLATGEFDPTAMANETTIDIAGDATDEFQDSITGFSRMSEDTDNRLTTNNIVVVAFDPAMASFQDAMSEDATPGTWDVDWATAAFDAMMCGLTDANGNAPSGDLAATNISEEEAAPLLSQVNFNTGDNETGGTQRISEQDGVAGDDPDNNVGRFIFNEELDVVNTSANIDETRFRFGAQATDLFSGGDFDTIEGGGNNIVVMTDGSGAGFGVGDSATILDENGVEDANGNVFGSTTAGVTVQDSTAPFIPLQLDVNGATILSAFLVDQDADGFADIIRMFFTKDVASTVDDADFSVAGVDQADISVSVSSNIISITLPSGAIPATSTLTVTYNGAAATEPIADASGNAVAAVNANFSVEAIPAPNADGEFTAVMNIAGTITGPDGNAAPAGTKVYGFIAVPVVKSASATTKNGIFYTVSDSSSMNAWTNWYLGLTSTIYLYDVQGDMYFENEKFDDGQDSLQYVTARFSTNGTTWTAKGSTTPGGNDSQPLALQTNSGTTTTGWDVLRSGNGTAEDLMTSGFRVGGRPIASAAVLLDDNGDYLLHMTAPESVFNGTSRLNAEGWPVIIVVELTTGERYICSSLTNGADNQGPILFGASQRDQTNAGAALSDLPFDIDLSTDVATGWAFPGWNLVGDDRNSGYANRSSDIPDVLPRGVTSGNVVLGTDVDLDGVWALHQFPFFYDDNSDGVWTSDDDFSDPFDGIVIDVNCMDYIAFTMTSDGVQVASPNARGGITAFTGGYGLGFFNGEGTDLGMFMFGPSVGSGAIFNSADVEDLNNNATLGWILNTAANSTTSAAFLGANMADFNIEFNRTSASMVDISTAATGGAGDQESVTAGQAYVTHYPEQ
ncbi:MAG: hypothetical protein H6813_05560 [Phycisphaeraceae bacterium]|nr:hypothetical protein [Phycisphaeraceae bacterium]MCB9847934.1 hypothetical protein [Phycisphaeraceae bacterium]